jgi:hypothetical protein
MCLLVYCPVLTVRYKKIEKPSIRREFAEWRVLDHIMIYTRVAIIILLKYGCNSITIVRRLCRFRTQTLIVVSHSFEATRFVIGDNCRARYKHRYVRRVRCKKYLLIAYYRSLTHIRLYSCYVVCRYTVLHFIIYVFLLWYCTSTRNNSITMCYTWAKLTPAWLHQNRVQRVVVDDGLPILTCAIIYGHVWIMISTPARYVLK